MGLRGKKILSEKKKGEGPSRIQGQARTRERPWERERRKQSRRLRFVEGGKRGEGGGIGSIQEKHIAMQKKKGLRAEEELAPDPPGPRGMGRKDRVILLAIQKRTAAPRVDREKK